MGSLWLNGLRRFNHGTRDPFFSLLKCESECESSRNFEFATLQVKQSVHGCM